MEIFNDVKVGDLVYYQTGSGYYATEHVSRVTKVTDKQFSVDDGGLRFRKSDGRMITSHFKRCARYATDEDVTRVRRTKESYMMRARLRAYLYSIDDMPYERLKEICDFLFGKEVDDGK